MSRVLKLLLSLIALIIVVLGAWVIYLNSMRGSSGNVTTDQAAIQYSASSTTPYSVLLKDNSAFAQADAYFSAGNYTSAISKYQEALVTAKDNAQIAQIQYQIARSTQASGDVTGSIPLYQAIGENTTFYPLIRAFAVQQLGVMLLTGSNANVQSKIFTSDPYATFLKQRSGDMLQATVDLFRYAASIYPLAIPLLVSTEYDVARAQVTTGISKPDAIAAAKASLAKADADMVRSNDNENEKSIIPLILRRRAVLVGRLAQIGGVPGSDADAAFALAMNSNSAVGPGYDGYDRFNYAAYLLSFNGARNADIHTVLAPLYSDASYKNSSVVPFFVAEKNNVFLSKGVLQALAKADPPFKTYLVSLGWKDADFK